MSTALVIVDAQNDFTEGGALGVEGATAAFQNIASHLYEHLDEYDLIAYSQDWHIDPGDHWSDQPDFEHSWPRHCEAGTHGAELNPIIEGALGTIGNTQVLRVIKGEFSSGYSGFEGKEPILGISLAEALRNQGVTELAICGVATDHCVAATSRDALREGFKIRLLTAQIAAVDADRGNAALEELRSAGAEIV